MSIKSKRLSLTLVLLLLLSCSFPVSAQEKAQLAQQALALRQARARAQARIEEAADALSDYFKEKAALPESPSEMDAFLVSNYGRITGEALAGNAGPSPNGSKRTLGGINIYFDPRVGSLTQINRKLQFPADWSGNPFELNIVSDGKSNFVVWAASENGKLDDLYCFAPLAAAGSGSP
ncbi:MAG: hypothetical protein K2X27_24265 [Candidatus Obscuribacterales bacterium]|nr:hypothetical protein [Candidatus Obscuribacterales bacterium]